MEYNKDNFQDFTIADFDNLTDDNHDEINEAWYAITSSGAGSYLSTETPEAKMFVTSKGVYRISRVWGIMEDINWTIKNNFDEDNNQLHIGYAKFSSFKMNEAAILDTSIGGFRNAGEA